MKEKLTTEEIKKALECCVGESPNCNDCPANRYEAGKCFDIVKVQAVAIMNSQQVAFENSVKATKHWRREAELNAKEIIRLQAEIERLEKELSTATNHITRLENQIERLLPMLKNKRAEAIKEFAERLKDYLRKQPKWSCRREKYDNVGFSYDDVFFGIDKVVKEMAGDDK